MRFRPYDAESDFDSVFRIHLEIGWAKDTEHQRKSVEVNMASARTLVAEVDGEVECLAACPEGEIRHLDEDLPLCVVSAVATSRVARRQKLASALTAEAIAAEVSANGAAVAILGIFDQGFYDKLGFGTGAYGIVAAIDPSDLAVDVEPRVPIRLSPDDWERIHRGRRARRRGHGALNLTPPEITRSEVLQREGAFGLGYADAGSEELTHHLWCVPTAQGTGPYWVSWLAYRSRGQLLELLALLKSFGDQVPLIRMLEPPGVQIQSLLRRPFRRRQISKGSKFESGIRAVAWWQARICDLPACLAATRLPSSVNVTFNLSLTDPIRGLLGEETQERWAGVAGDYIVTLGPESGAERRDPDPRLSTMRTSVNTFTRLWLGVGRPSDLGLTSPDLDAPEDLLEQLDRVLTLPRPVPGWDI